MTIRARNRRAKRKRVFKARSKSEMKRLYAMGIEDVDPHLDWCAIREIGMCSCGGENTPDEPPPASEASGDWTCGQCGRLFGGGVEKALHFQYCQEEKESSQAEKWAQEHIEALKLLKQACQKITAARALLGDKEA